MGTKRSYPFAEKIKQYQGYEMRGLIFALKDARDARGKAGDMDGGEVENWYADDAFTIGDEIRGRKDGSRARRLPPHYA